MLLSPYNFIFSFYGPSKLLIPTQETFTFSEKLGLQEKNLLYCLKGSEVMVALLLKEDMKLRTYSNFKTFQLKKDKRPNR